jgi:hypothetical protein
MHMQQESTIVNNRRHQQTAAYHDRIRPRQCRFGIERYYFSRTDVSISDYAADTGRTASLSRFADLYFYLLDVSLPDDDKKVRTVILQASEFTLENGILWHVYTPRTRKLDRAYSVIKRICLPEKFRNQAAYTLHDSDCHAGTDRPFALVRLKYYYPGQYTHLREHVLSCEVSNS